MRPYRSVTLAVFAAFVLTAAPATAQVPCAQGPVQFGNSTYDFICTPLSWPAASAAATAVGPTCHLAVITSLAENAFLDTLADNLNGWVGGSQPPGSGEPADGWGWVTGEPFAFTAWDVGGGEPNENPPPEDCLEFLDSGLWNDLDCASEALRGYFVECDGATIADIPTLSPTGGSLLAAAVLLAALYALRNLRRRYPS